MWSISLLTVIEAGSGLADANHTGLELKLLGLVSATEALQVQGQSKSSTYPYLMAMNRSVEWQLLVGSWFNFLALLYNKDVRA